MHGLLPTGGIALDEIERLAQAARLSDIVGGNIEGPSFHGSTASFGRTAIERSARRSSSTNMEQPQKKSAPASLRVFTCVLPLPHANAGRLPVDIHDVKQRHSAAAECDEEAAQIQPCGRTA